MTCECVVELDDRVVNAEPDAENRGIAHRSNTDSEEIDEHVLDANMQFNRIADVLLQISHKLCFRDRRIRHTRDVDLREPFSGNANGRRVDIERSKAPAYLVTKRGQQPYVNTECLRRTVPLDTQMVVVNTRAC